MSELPACPSCNENMTYPDGDHLACPMCGHEWSSEQSAEIEVTPQYRDAHGTRLEDGDTVTLIKDLRVKGSSTVLKMGTRISNIRLVKGDHDVDCRVDGQKFLLKSCFMKKA